MIRFKSEDERIPLYQIVEECFPRLLNILRNLVPISNPPIEVADLIKLICKIFWSSIYVSSLPYYVFHFFFNTHYAMYFLQLEIPKQLFDPNVFNTWMILFLNLLERPVPVEGQPLDPDARKSWGWWKVKKWIIHILNRLYTRSVSSKLFVILVICILNLVFITGLLIWSFRDQKAKPLLKCSKRTMLEKFWGAICSCSMQYVLVAICLIGLSILFFNILPTGLWKNCAAAFCISLVALWSAFVLFLPLPFSILSGFPHVSHGCNQSLSQFHDKLL